ncbi:MAG: hypothetical protein V5B60_20685 [Accumulibacter sp.]|uniref:hypothetical protein n=1 Tax=Accumulibacter sp. TaxID=2053492 RepID=UPI002FC285D0
MGIWNSALNNDFDALGGDDWVDVGEGNDAVYGGAGVDTLRGGNGNDTLEGGTEADLLVGGAGDDYYVVDRLGDQIVEAADEGNDTVRVRLSSAGTFVLPPNVNDAIIDNATAGVNLTGNALANRLTGNNLANVLLGLGGDDQLNGLDGDDSLTGGAGKDKLYGGAGNDRLYYESEADELYGGVGDDRFAAGDPTKQIDGTTHVLNGGSGKDRLELAGAAADYRVRVDIPSSGSWEATTTTTMARRAGSSLPDVTLSTQEIEKAVYQAPIANVVVLEGANTISEMARQMIDVYAAQPRVGVFDDAAGTPRNWHPVAAIELGMQPSGWNLHGQDVGQYLFAAGVYEEKALKGYIFINDTTATVWSGLVNVNGQKTLSISFKGSGADVFDWVYDVKHVLVKGSDDLKPFYEKHRPLVDALKTYLAEEGARIDQVLVSGHSLGGAMVQHLVAELGPLVGNKIHGYTFGSIGGDSGTAGPVTGKVVNFVHRGDIANWANTSALLSLFGGSHDTRGGTQVIIRTALASTPWGEHFKDAYGQDVNFLLEAAADLTTGFSRSSLAASLRSGEVWQGDGDRPDQKKLQLATGTDNDDALGYGRGDRFILGGKGNDRCVFLNDAASLVIDGGAGWDFATILSGDTATRQPDGRIDVRDGSGQVLGTLYSIEEAVFSGPQGWENVPATVQVAGSSGPQSMQSMSAGASPTVQRPAPGTTVFTVDGGSDYADAGDGEMTVIGTSGGDTIFAGRGDKAISGGDGNDTLIVEPAYGVANLTETIVLDGGSGKDLMIGAQGNETFIVDDRGDVVVDLGGTDRVESSVSFELPDGVEHLDLQGLDAIDGMGNDSANQLRGNVAANRLFGEGGADTLIGGDGSDIYGVDDAGDQVIESNAVTASGGSDLVLSMLAAYTLPDHVENGRIVAGGAANLTGNRLDNLLDAGVGDNLIAGDAGSDTLSWAHGVIGAGGVSASLVTGIASGGSGSDRFTGIEHLIGSTDDDSLTGDGNANFLQGGAGNDTLNGGAGADTLAGGDGNDTYYVDSAGDVVTETNADPETGGSDDVHSYLQHYTLPVHVENGRIRAASTASLSGNGLDNQLYAGAGDNVIAGDAGSDTLSWAYGVNGASGVVASLITGIASGGSGADAFSGIESLDGSAYADTLSGDGHANRLDGAQGNDFLDGGAGDDSLTGGTGDDTLWGGAGADSLLGGDGSDRYYVDNAGDSVSETSSDPSTGGIDQVYSSLSAYTLVAWIENGRILASSAASLTGNDLDNLLYAGSGNNLLDGAGGNDTASYLYGGSSGVRVHLGVSGAQTTGGSGSDTLVAIENLAGSNYADVLSGDGNSNRLEGAGDNDILVGGGGDDTLDGGAGDDTLVGGAGNDRLWGGSGADSLVGGDGSDSYYLDHAGDSVTETNDNPASGGTDQVFSTLAAYTLGAHVENGRILAAGAANLAGNSLDNLLDAGTGDNLLDGGGGSDTVSYLNAVSGSGVSLSLAVTGAQVTGGSGSDTLVGIENLIGSVYVDTLTGDGNANRLEGLSGNDSLDGGAGNDTLDGGAGNDRLWGGTGADSLLGGDGSDFYYVDHTGDSVSESNADSTTGGTDQVFSSLAAYILGAHIENGRILASGVASLTGNDLDNRLYGGTGNNLLDGAGGNDTASYLYGVSSGVSVSLALAGAQATGGSGSDTLVGIENLSGSIHADTLTGDGNANRLEGANGNDTLAGGAGDDTLDGGLGADSLIGGDGSDLYHVDQVGDSVTETNANPATGGTDQVFSTLAAFTLTTHVENGRILSSGAASLTGNGLNNLLEAGTGNNLLDGAGGNDTVSYLYAVSGSGVSVSLAIAGAQATGGSSSDTLAGIENLSGSIYDDTLTGDANANRLSGAQGNDFLNGGAGNDTLDGGTGNDRLWGGTGADSLVGGDGSDFYYLDDAGDSVTESNANPATGGTDQVLSYLASTTLGAHVENGRILATGAANLSGNTLDNLLDAGTGNNLLDGAGGSDTVSYLYAVSGSGVSVSLALSGAQATGGSGSDTLAGIENLSGSTYDDTLTGDGNANRLNGAQGNDFLNGNAGNDSLDGGAGNDTLWGGTGADSLVGGDGNDSYYVDHAGDSVTETNANATTGGIDQVFSSLAAYTLGANVENGRILATGAASLSGNALANLLYAGVGNNLFDGAGGNDTVSYLYGASSGVTASLATGTATGGSGSDTLVAIDNLVGSAYADTLSGDGGANVLSGGTGNDTLSGGLGADTFRFDMLPNAATNRDTISDLNVLDDTIELENAIFNSLPNGPLAATSFRSGAGVTAAADADDYLIYDTTSGALYYDANGNTGAGPVQVATLASGLALSHLDFLVT